MHGIVMKFGGSSVADAACMRQVAELVRAASQRAPLVVLSAMGKTTNGLFEAARAAESGHLEAALEGMQAVKARHFQTAGELFAGNVSAKWS
jgi:aspartate kinase